MKKRTILSMLGMLGVGMTGCGPEPDMYGPAPMYGPASSMYHPSERVEDDGIDIMDDSETNNENLVEE